MWKKTGLTVLFIAIFLLSAPFARAAVTFDLVPPSGQLSRGQDVTFTINMDTGGETIMSIQTGMTYDTVFLEYQSAAAGAAMQSLSVDTSQGTGKLVLTGSNSSGFTGSGVFATVVFKIIADQPGETELCSLWAVTPTTAPSQCNSSCTSNTDCTGGLYCYVLGGQTSGFCRNQTCPDQVNCTCIQPTNPPVPTALPQTGFELPQNTGLLAGSMFLVIAGSIYMYMKKNTYTEVSRHHHSRHKKTESK